MADAPQRLLNPVESPIGLFNEFIRDKPVTMVLNGKLFAAGGDDFIVSDTEGNDVLRVHAEAMSWRDKQTVSTLDHLPLYSLRRKALALKHLTYVEDNSGKELFTIQEEWSLKSKLRCDVPTEHGTVRLNIHGRAFKYAAEIKLDDDTVIATISREGIASKDGAIKNRQSYYITVAPGVDLSLIVVLCIVFDNLKRAEARRHA